MIDLPPNCRACGTPFDEANTGYKRGRRLADGSPGSWTRYCRACQRAAANRWNHDNRAGTLHRAERQAKGGRPRIYAAREEPVVETPRPVDHSRCVPWEGRACVECEGLWAEVVAENTMAVAS